MKDGNEPIRQRRNEAKQQTGEEHGSIKGPQRGPDDFHGKGRYCARQRTGTARKLRPPRLESPAHGRWGVLPER